MGTWYYSGRDSVIEISGSVLAISNTYFMPFPFFVIDKESFCESGKYKASTKLQSPH
jgi:hypothetical protein